MSGGQWSVLCPSYFLIRRRVYDWCICVCSPPLHFPQSPSQSSSPHRTMEHNERVDALYMLPPLCFWSRSQAGLDLRLKSSTWKMFLQNHTQGRQYLGNLYMHTSGMYWKYSYVSCTCERVLASCYEEWNIPANALTPSGLLVMTTLE